MYQCAAQNICKKTVDGSARTTLQTIPKFFYKSRAYEITQNLRTNFGASLTTPSGLSMNWDGPGGGFLKDVGIAMIEFNPVVSLAWRDFISFGVGFRAIYSFGSFNNILNVPTDVVLKPNIKKGIEGVTNVTQSSNASGFGFGYNLALSVRPFAGSDMQSLKSLTISSTYRSKVGVDMNGELSALASVFALINVSMNSDLTLMADIPNILNVGISQDFGNSRLEFVYERTFWDDSRIFDFNYSNQKIEPVNKGATPFKLPFTVIPSVDYSAVAMGNGWKDSNAYRLGYTYFGKTFKIMGSIAYDETPAPQGKFGIPDADAYMVGLGFRKRFFSDKLDIGVGYSLALKDNRKSFIVSHDGLGQLHLLTVGLKYLFQ